MKILIAFRLKSVLTIMNKHINPMHKVHIVRRLETNPKWEKIQCGSLKSFYLNSQIQIKWAWSSDFPSVYDF